MMRATTMDKKEQNLRTEFETLDRKLADPKIFTTPDGQKVAKRHAELKELLELFDAYNKVRRDRDEALKLSSEQSELSDLATAELPDLEKRLHILDEQLQTALIPKDPNNSKNAIVEIRAGAGGDEASLFAGELYRMYMLYSESKKWRLELISESPSDVGGFKEIVFNVNGDGAYGNLKYESGVHRVQRIPATESQGRIHTSTATVAVLPEAEEADIEINPSDIRIDVFRSSGPGGQSVNTTDSAVRITHLPTGIIVTCQDEKSQHKNKAKALSVLRSRLLANKIEEEQKKQSEQRRSQIGSGDRSEKIRTYNFPQDRVTDHRIKVSLSNLPSFMNGQIGELIEKLAQAERELQKSRTDT